MPKNFSFRVTNDTPQSERREILRRERAGATYHQFAASEADVPRGRFTAHERSAVTGATPVPQYPALPGSAWSNQAAAVPPEEPLGVNVNAVEPAGTAAEIEHSLRGVHDRLGSTPSRRCRAGFARRRAARWHGVPSSRAVGAPSPPP